MLENTSIRGDLGMPNAEVRFPNRSRFTTTFEIQHSNLAPSIIRNSPLGISPARRLAVMHLALRGIEADFGTPAGAGPNTFRRDLGMSNVEVRMWN